MSRFKKLAAATAVAITLGLAASGAAQAGYWTPYGYQVTCGYQWVWTTPYAGYWAYLCG
jgi:hypothetical protein